MPARSFLFLIWFLVLLPAPTDAKPRDALRHPTIAEVLSLTKSGVADAVIAERVARLEVPALDTVTIVELSKRGVSHSVITALLRHDGEPVECPPSSEMDRAWEHPSIRRVLRKVEEGASGAELLGLARSLQDVPVLDGQDLEKLRNKGVPNRTLLELMRKTPLTGSCHSPESELETRALEAPEEPEEPSSETVDAPAMLATHGARAPRGAAPPPQEIDAEDSLKTGGLRVMAKSSLPVSYLEVVLNGEVVVREGHIRQAVAEPGWTLSGHPRLDLDKAVTLYDSELPMGLHRVETAFAVTRIVPTDLDPATGFRGERYDTTTVAPEDGDTGGATCEIREGWVCVVTANLVKRRDGYAVTYEAKMRRSSAGQKD